MFTLYIGDSQCINFIFCFYHSSIVYINLDTSVVKGSDNKDGNIYKYKYAFSMTANYSELILGILYLQL